MHDERLLPLQPIVSTKKCLRKYLQNAHLSNIEFHNCDKLNTNREQGCL